MTRAARLAGSGALLGLLAALLAAAFTVAPVVQRTADYTWDLSGGVVANPVPLTSYRPVELVATTGCVQRDALPGGTGAMLSTTHGPAATGPTPDGLWIGAVGETVEVRSAGQLLWSGPDCDITVRIAPDGWSVSAGEAVLADGPDDVRPFTGGFFSELPRDSPVGGLSATVTADTRFESSPSVTKIVLGIGALVLVIASLTVLFVVDRQNGRRIPRALRRTARGLRWSDLPVVGALALWTLIGPVTPDDGYTTTMVADAARSGFVGGYHHWLNSPEAPFGSFYEPMRFWAGEGTPLLWMRIPALVLALLGWWMLSRFVLPRVLPGARRVRWVPWLAAAAFLTGWLPFDVGLRSEPYVAVGAVAVWCLAEYGVATRRLLPTALAVLVAGLTVTVAPTGLIAAVVLCVLAPAVVRALRGRRADGYALAGAVLAAGGLSLLVMFSDQTLGTVRAGTAVRTAIGPNLPWSDEWIRYQSLLLPPIEGSFGRRVAVLTMLVALVALAVLLLARRYRIPGSHRARALRAVWITGAGLAALIWVPTKWTHHFGGFAGHLTVLVVLLAWAARGLAARTRAFLLAAVAAATALALTGTAIWWGASSQGVTFWNIPPEIAGIRLATVSGLLAIAWFAAGLILVWRSMPGRWHVLVPPVGLVLATVLVGSLTIQTYGMVRAAVAVPGYSQQRATAAALVGDRCGLEPFLHVEPNPSAGVLAPEPGPAGAAVLGGAAHTPVDREDHASRESLPPDLLWTIGDGDPGFLRSAWYALPPDLDRPLVVEAGGNGDGRATVEFARRDGVVPDVVASVDLLLEERVTGRRIDVAEVAPDAELVRVTAQQTASAPEAWLTVSRPRIPQTVPLNAAFPAGQPALLDWQVAPLLTCRRQATLAGGIAEVPAFVVAQGRDLPEAMTRSAGGPFAAVLQAYRLEPMPTYVDGEPDAWRAQVLRVVPREPVRPPVRTEGERILWGASGRPPMR